MRPSSPGVVDVAAMKARVDGGLGGALEGRSPTLMAMPLDHLLSKESIDARLVPGVGPMPLFNATCAPVGSQSVVLHSQNTVFDDSQYAPCNQSDPRE